MLFKFVDKLVSDKLFAKLRNPFASPVFLIKRRSVGNTVKGQGSFKASPAGHDFAHGTAFPKRFRITPPVFYLSGAGVDGSVMGQHHVAVAAVQE